MIGRTLTIGALPRTHRRALSLAGVACLVGACSGGSEPPTAVDSGGSNEAAANPATTLPTETLNADDSDDPPATEPPATEPVQTDPPLVEEVNGIRVEDVDLRGLCPNPVVIQTDWNPESEHGGAYELLGPGYEIDAEQRRVRGPLVSSGIETGIDIEIRAGGPAIGFQSVPPIMYQQPDIMFGYVSTDDAVEFSVSAPTVAVLAPLEKNPQMLMWDPATYPDIEGIADLGAAGVPVRYFEGEPYMDFLVSEGIIDPSTLDASYNGDPLVFLEEDGRIAQQGFSSSEPYIYENDVAEWGRPLQYQLVFDTGWQPYPSAMAARPEVINALPDCFERLVPIMQRAQVEYVSAPERTNETIFDLVPDYDTGWTYSQGVADYAVATMLADELVSNGPDDTLGNFDIDRVEQFLGFAVPALEAAGLDVRADLTPADLVTNAFIDPTIGL